MSRIDSTNINLEDLTKIPEKEFKQHFRDWMEQDDVARSLQAKLRKDLILNFNKTSLGKKIISESAVCHRLTLSPLILALNTLVAEFLYALNCHFALSVFCTEVPYRNTLPNFTVAGHFRFSEREIFEIFDALCSNFQSQSKDVICKEYSKEGNNSLLLILLRNLLSSQTVLKEQPPVQLTHEPPEQVEKTKKLDSKAECQSNNFRYLNKYLIVLSRKVKEMSQNLKLLEKKRNAPQIQRKSLQTRKFEKLNHSLEKISDNLRQMSVSRRKNKKLTEVVTAVNSMAIQFEKCTMNFENISRGFNTAGAEKSYNDWIKEMRTTDNGRKFLEKVESSLRKTLHRENEKKDRELEQRLQIQKDILKTKYKQKLAEKLIKHTSRGNEDSVHKTNESFEQKLHEFEEKHKELHQRIHDAEERIRVPPAARVESPTKYPVIDSRGTQTAIDTIRKSTKITPNQLQQMVNTISEQERQIDHIVFDAKLRIQELEHESNQLDRSFHDYLERQRSDKQKMRETATSIWQNYALGKSMLDKKCATYRLPPRKIEKQAIVSEATPAIPIINIDPVSTENHPVFENPYRTAQRKVLARSRTLPPAPLTPTDTDSSAHKYTQSKGQQQPSVYRLIEHSYDGEVSHTKAEENLPARCIPTRATTQVAQLSPELNLQDITLDGIEISARSSSLRSGESNGSSSSPRGVFKLRRQLFTTTDNGGSGPSSSNGQLVNSNSNKKAEEPLKQINKENGDDGKKSIDGDRKDVSLDKSTTAMRQQRKGDEKRACEGPSVESSGDRTEAPLPLTGVGEDVSSQSFHLDNSEAGQC